MLLSSAEGHCYDSRHACFYDGTRGTEGTVGGLPIGLEGRGKVRYARQGEARVPCLKLPSQTFLVARVPFSKNGGGDHLNQFTLTLHAKFLEELPEAIYSTAGRRTHRVAAPRLAAPRIGLRCSTGSGVAALQHVSCRPQAGTRGPRCRRVTTWRN